MSIKHRKGPFLDKITESFCPTFQLLRYTFWDMFHSLECLFGVYIKFSGPKLNFDWDIWKIPYVRNTRKGPSQRYLYKKSFLPPFSCSDVDFGTCFLFREGKCTIPPNFITILLYLGAFRHISLKCEFFCKINFRFFHPCHRFGAIGHRRLKFTADLAQGSNFKNPLCKPSQGHKKNF